MSRLSFHISSFIILCLSAFMAFSARGDPLPDESPLSFLPLQLDAAGDVREPNTVIMPGLSDPTVPAGPLGRLVTRNMRTGEVTIRENITREEFLGQYAQPGGEGVLTGPAVESSAKNFSSWAFVGDPTVGTYPMHLKVNICFDGPCNEPYGGNCSGTLIDPMHVITAAHCAYDFDENHPGSDDGWAEEIRVLPGYHNGIEPWGHAHAEFMHSWEGWTVDHDAHHDIAILDLDRPIGALVGWRGYGNNDDCDWYYGGGWVHRGYPAEDPFNGQVMYENGGSFDHCWSDGTLDWHLAAFDSPSWGGHSGSGSVRDAVVWAILRGSDRETSTDAALITETKFNDITAFRLWDMPNTPDLMPIYVQAHGLYFEPGEQLAEFSFVLVSYAEQGLNSSVICRIFLSDDTTITTGDVWLDDVTVPVNLPFMGAQTVGVWPPPTVPPATAAGRYYLGVILDYTDAILSNNITAEVELDSIFVSCPAPATPTILSPVEGEVCQPLTRTIDWSDQPLIETYQIRFGTWCGETLYDTGTISQFTATGLDNGTTYYATVRAKKYCGSWSPWSGCRSFTTLDIPTSEVDFLIPPEGDTCQDSTLVSFAWQPVPGATKYELRVGESCGSGGTYPLSSSTPYCDVTGLMGGTTYEYHVRVRGACGNWGDWSACRDFSTLPGIYTIPQGTFPPDTYACMSPRATLSWLPVSYPAMYEVEWGASCRMDTATTVATNLLYLPILAEGTWYWHVRALHGCGGMSSWSDCYSFGVDATPPVWPIWLESTTHALSTWSKIPEVKTLWEDAADDCNVEYAVLWDHAPTTVPDSLALHIMDVFYTSDPLPDGDDHWFHVLAKDMPGNLADTPQHLGPFWIDTTPPEIQVQSPVGGQSLVGGTAATIVWTAVDVSSGLDTGELHYTIDAEDTWVPIASIPDPLVTTHEWTVPEAVTDSARVRVTFTDAAGNAGAATNERWFSIVSPTGIDLPGGGAKTFALIGNHPNPFNPQTTIAFELPEQGAVTLRVFELQGRLVRVLMEGKVYPNGRHEAIWNGRDDAGRQVASGTYFYRLEAGGYRETKRMVLIK